MAVSRQVVLNSFFILDQLSVEELLTSLLSDLID